MPPMFEQAMNNGMMAAVVEQSIPGCGWIFGSASLCCLLTVLMDDAPKAVSRQQTKDSLPEA